MTGGSRFDTQCGQKKKRNLFFVLGNEQRVKFWKDKWCGDSPLNIAFPLLFAFARAKGACGGMFGVWSKVGEPYFYHSIQ